jgi:hypothetical protein
MSKTTNKFSKRAIILYSLSPIACSIKGIDALQRHCTDNWEKIFPERKLRGLRPNIFIHISVSDLYIPTVGLPIWLKESGWTDREIYISLTDK